VREVHIDAAPDTVFAFFVDPDRIVRWMGKTATLEPRPGGLFRIDYGQGDVARGEFVEVDRPRRVVFTWGWEKSGDPVQPGQSTVEVDLEPAGEGTLVRLRHSGLGRDSRKSHDEGWIYFLARLRDVASASAAGRASQ
jgi:uncharacterized protein YndB with AHSA1/START domain